jgi:integrase
VELVNTVLDRLQQGDEIRTAQTRKHYERIVKMFGLWLMTSARLDKDPFARLKVTFVGEDDAIHNRKPFTLAQINAIIDAARTGGTYRKLTGDQRALLYLAAAYTGLRAKECAAVRRVDFTDDMAYVRVAGAFTKNSREAVQPIASFLRPILAAYVSNLHDEDFLWPGGWTRDDNGKWTETGWVKGKEAGEMLRHDAKAVNIIIGRQGREANGGAVLDFHSFRHFFTTQCDQAGISDGLRLKLSRASCQAILTRYTHHDLVELGAAVERLPAVKWNEPGSTDKPAA